MSTKTGRRESVSSASPPGMRRTVRISEETATGSKPSATGNMYSKTNTTSSGHAASLADTVLGDDSLSMTTNLSRLEKDLERRKISYRTREEAYQGRVTALEDELASQNRGSPGGKKAESKLSELKAIQSEILNSVELVQDRTARIMQDQERDLLRSFRARLFDVQSELEKEKSKKDDGLAAWRERYTQLEAELDWATEVSSRLDKVNQTLTQENNDLKMKFQSQEQDRKLFIELLVSLKKDNSLWRSKNTEIIAEIDRLKIDLTEQQDLLTGQSPLVAMAAKGFSATGGVGGGVAGITAAQQSIQQQRAESEERFKDANVRLRRLLAEERKSLQQVRQNYAQELKIRTEMEVLLRKCVDDVRQAIAEFHHESAQFSHHTTGNDLSQLYNSQPGSVPFEAFDQEERERTLELLLSQERVVSLIYAKTFPVVTKSSVGHQPYKSLHKSNSRAPDSPTAGAVTGGDVLAGLDGIVDVDDTGMSSRPNTAGAAAIGNAPASGSAKSEKFPPISSASVRQATR